mmetsp:Transcript_23268/g.46435  ORF Transcript_23268/g.46435 Transcript_23268/m.46435 type:complete len:161 (+) Transcript_23268:44-526(+)|eukprot:CAMPEP_0194318978 /NCGR_PEP_ID=MMETSP0171-20130528/15508_1 /TAXON_ID=218684 /ORGANISM="Corethron pennatum, Strain L29A3" /LENGTH=160 /DNA_ID=CAMNT_0039076043 /DNA_START=18 /DNA_END=500 /DNA_ORIENTATION=-
MATPPDALPPPAEDPVTSPVTSPKKAAGLFPVALIATASAVRDAMVPTLDSSPTPFRAPVASAVHAANRALAAAHGSYRSAAAAASAALSPLGGALEAARASPQSYGPAAVAVPAALAGVGSFVRTRRVPVAGVAGVAAGLGAYGIVYGLGSVDEYGRKK